MTKRQQLAEERRRLIGFVRTVFSFQREQAPAPGAAPLESEQIQWDDVPISGLRMAAADMVEWCQDIAGEPLAYLVATLNAAQLPTLTAMRDAQYREAVSMLARDAVRTEADWHVLNRLVVNMADSPLSASERDQAERLSLEYRSKSHHSA